MPKMSQLSNVKYPFCGVDGECYQSNDSTSWPHDLVLNPFPPDPNSKYLSESKNPCKMDWICLLVAPYFGGPHFWAPCLSIDDQETENANLITSHLSNFEEKFRKPQETLDMN